MNVLILTPDAVGSTLLQRLLTIYMQFHGYDRPVINLHELTNGLVKYHHDHFNQEVLGKKHNKWGYHQSLSEVVELLSSVHHYKTSRLAHYHIRNRQDTMADQVQFYQYLNDNFYIISCRRHNLFEHALSWGLTKITKKLNVYNADEKIDNFMDLYKNGVELDPNVLIQTLNNYKNYIIWCNNHFEVANYFYYEEHLPVIEKYILNLPIFPQPHAKLTWKENFGMSFDQWNLCHYLTSDIGTLALDQPEKFAKLTDARKKVQINLADQQLVIEYNKIRDPNWPTIAGIEDFKKLPSHIRTEAEQVHGVKIPGNNEIWVRTTLPQPLIELLPIEHQDFINKHKENYSASMSKIHQMVQEGIMINNPPIKKQTLAEKKYMIKNYANLLKVYNQWIEQNPDMGNKLDNDILDKFADIEQARWNPANSAVTLFDSRNID